MGAQSLVIGKMFGEGFQYGKRKISAMKNDEFNKLTFEDMMSNARQEIQASIPTMQAAMRDMTPMVETIIQEFTSYLSKVINAVPTVAVSVAKDVAVSGLGGPAGIAYEQVFQMIKDMFPSLPEAEARRGADSLASAIGASAPAPQYIGTKFKQSTISGLTVEQAREQARQKQLLYEQQQREYKKAQLLIKKDFKPVVPQLGIAESQAKVKRKAGQSQIMARKEFIREIAQAHAALKKGAAVIGRAETMATIKHLRRVQQQLVNLLARYRFD